MEFFNEANSAYYTAEDLEKLVPVLSSHVADALKHIGIKNCVIQDYIKPMTVTGHKIIGSACTMMAGPARDPNCRRGLKELIDDVSKPGDVIVMDINGYTDAVMLGGRAAYRAKKKGVGAIFIDGSTRDIEEIREMDYPVFAKSRGLLASEGEIELMGFNIPVMLGGVVIKQGDIIVADDTGAVVIPKECAKKAIAYAVDRQEIDDESFEALKAGRPYVHQHFHDDDLEHLHSVD